LAAVIVTLAASDHQLVVFKGQIKLIGAKPGDGQRDAQPFCFAILNRYLLDIVGRIPVRRTFGDTFKNTFDLIEPDKERRGKRGVSHV
jgi:hypothetical protein